MSEEKIEKIKTVDKKSRITQIEEQISQINQPIEGKFEALLDKTHPEKMLGVAHTSESGANAKDVEAAAKLEGAQQGAIPTSKEVIALTKETTQKIEGIKEALQTAESSNVDIKKPVEQLMQSKLTHVEDQLKIALSKAGMEVSPEAPQAVTEQFTPIANFINHLTHSQYQLESLGNYIDGLVASKGELSAANMLSIQIKVTHVQQELEFFSNLLNKALESTKALLNVQV